MKMRIVIDLPQNTSDVGRRHKAVGAIVEAALAQRGTVTFERVTDIHIENEVKS